MRGRDAGPVCDKDCFRCPHPDCVLDAVDYDDILEQRRRDRILTQTPEKAKIAAYDKAYYAANREEIAARHKAYRAANREKYVDTGAMIRAARKAAGYTQKELAALLGISRATVCCMESGVLPADLSALSEILPITKEGA